MDASTIAKLQEFQVAAHFADDLEASRQASALPADFKVHDLEKFAPERRRFRGSYHTHLVDAFARYIASIRGFADAPVYINAEHVTAAAYLNAGTTENPGHCDDTAWLKLQPTAAFAALTQLEQPSLRLAQRLAAEWMEDWREQLTAFDGEGNELPTNRAIAAIRKLKIEASRAAEHSVDDMKTSASLLESIEAKSELGLPHHLIFTCEPYHGLAQRDFHLRVGISNSDAGCTVLLRPVMMEQAREDIAREFSELVEKALPSTCQVLIGVFTP